MERASLAAASQLPPVSLHAVSPNKLKKKKNLACVLLRHINADIDPHYIGPQFLSERSRSVVADLH